jgi:DNA-binding NarL/FixJ family response regulator
MNRPRVLLADDHALLLGAFEKLLAEECDIVGQVSDGRALVAAAQELRPDIIVLDITMPFLNGIEAARQIKHALPRIKLVFVTMNEDTGLAADAFRAGASAYLLKHSATSELLTAIREAMAGNSYVTPLITEGLVGSLMYSDESAVNHELTPRQREVLQLLAEGRSMKEAAALLNLTPRTVAFHKYRIMQQLKVKSNAELVQYAVRHHVV